MNQRLCLFFAGYCAYNPALYYSLRSLIEEFSETEDAQLKSGLGSLSDSLAEAHYEPESNVRTALSIASRFDIITLSTPTSAEAYFEWREHYTGQFEMQFPMSRIDHYYFLYARKLAEVFCNVGIAEKLLGLKQNFEGEFALDRKIDKYLKDSEYILFKLIAAAALLSSEPRHNCFNQHYKHLCKEYEKFKDLQLEGMGKEKIESLQNEFCHYQKEVEAGIKNCVAVLKDLGI